MLIKITLPHGTFVRVNPRAIDIVEPAVGGSLILCQHNRQYETKEEVEDLNARIEREREEFTRLHEQGQAEKRPKDPKAKAKS